MKDLIEKEVLPNSKKTEDGSNYRRYEEYKPSESLLMDEIPEQWVIGKLKHFCLQVTRGNSPDYVEMSQIPVINQACIYQGGLRLENVKYQREVDISKWKGCLSYNDVLINSTGTGTLGRVVLFRLRGIWLADSHVTIIRPNETFLVPSYLMYLIHSSLYQLYMNTTMVSGSTNQIELSREQLRSSDVLVPPVLEQHAIVSFLDQETAKINTLITKRERMIELLQERRTAIINQAVTKGLNPDVKMKDSGVEWLGKIPEHWQMKRLKFIADILPGVTKGKDLTDKNIVEMPYLRVANVQSGYLDLSDVATILVSMEDAKRYLLKPGDVLMNEGGDNDKLGRGFIWDGSIDPCLHQNHVFAVRPFSVEDSHWISTVTQTNYAKHYFMLKAKQSTNLASISKTNIQNFSLVLPPLEEQLAILRYINEATVKIDRLITGIQQSIQKLKEYSTALISAAVTGKIDVRREVDVVHTESVEGVAG